MNYPTDPAWPEEYIGDGVYAAFDGYAIILRTERHDDECPGTHWIALEPSMINAIKEFHDKQRTRQLGNHRGKL
jgi:hypothetical protein